MKILLLKSADVVTGNTEYFTKWEGLTYDEATWEGIDDISTRMNDPFIEQSTPMRQKIGFKVRLYSNEDSDDRF